MGGALLREGKKKNKSYRLPRSPHKQTPTPAPQAKLITTVLSYPILLTSEIIILVTGEPSFFSPAEFRQVIDCLTSF